MMVYSVEITLSPGDFDFVSLSKTYPHVYSREAAGKGDRVVKIHPLEHFLALLGNALWFQHCAVYHGV